MSTIAVTYRGAGATRPGLPARDIDAAELAFLAAGRKVDLETFVEQLVDTGLYTAVSEEPFLAEPTPTLADHTKPELGEIATGLGLELPSKAVKADIIAAIEAEQQRLAEEEAAAKASETSDSGEGDQGGTGTPGDDPEATASGEPGTPPSGASPSE